MIGQLNDEKIREDQNADMRKFVSIFILKKTLLLFFLSYLFVC